jgi:hypothetical protein
MTQSLAKTTEPVRVPKDMEQLFDEPPLVGTEQRESYYAFFSILATAVVGRHAKSQRICTRSCRG